MKYCRLTNSLSLNLIIVYFPLKQVHGTTLCHKSGNHNFPQIRRVLWEGISPTYKVLVKSKLNKANFNDNPYYEVILCQNMKHDIYWYKMRDSHRAEYKITVFWDVTLCVLVDLYQRFEETYCFHLIIFILFFYSNIGGCTFFRNVGRNLPDSTV
jgi:hypothetical protein